MNIRDLAIAINLPTSDNGKMKSDDKYEKLSCLSGICRLKILLS